MFRPILPISRQYRRHFPNQREILYSLVMSKIEKTQKQNFACFGFKIIVFLKKFLDRSVSFLRQETHEHVKTIKKHCLEAKNIIFHKNAFENKYVFLGGFPPGAAAIHRRVFCLDFFGMFKLFWECLDIFWNV